MSKVKTYPKSQVDGKPTTKEQWDAYERELKAHEERVKREEPVRNNFSAAFDYECALAEWERMRSMDAPNEPGYYRANND